MTARAKRLVSFLCGVHADKGVRISRARLAAAADQSERSVKRSLAELVGYNWVTIESHGGSGTPSFIRVINTIDWILAPVGSLAPVKSVLAPVSPILAPVSGAYNLKEVKETQRGLCVENFNPHPYARALAELRERVPGAHPDDLAVTAQQMYLGDRKPPVMETDAPMSARRQA